VSKAESREIYLDSAARAALGFTSSMVPLCDVWEAWHRAPENIRPVIYQLESARYRIDELRHLPKSEIARLLKTRFNIAFTENLRTVTENELIMRHLAAEMRWIDLSGARD
jgi:hypothetical protein